MQQLAGLAGFRRAQGGARGRKNICAPHAGPAPGPTQATLCPASPPAPRAACRRPTHERSHLPDDAGDAWTILKSHASHLLPFLFFPLFFPEENGSAGARTRPRPAARRARRARALSGDEGAALGAHGLGAAGRGGRARGAAMKRRSARPTAFGLHAARRQNSCNMATREAIPANHGRPGEPIALVRSPAGQLNHRR